MHRHGYKGIKLQRERDQRKSLVRSLMTDMIEHGFVVTTRPKALAIRSDLEKLVTTAKKSTLASRRRVIGKLHTIGAAHKLVDEIAVGFKDRNGGYTRLEHAGYRRGDGSEIVRLSFTEMEASAVKAKKKEEVKTVKKTDKKSTAKAKATKPKSAVSAKSKIQNSKVKSSGRQTASSQSTVKKRGDK